ncbi:hypothetical protein vseg_006503 [Gypsophila vaccaria]
MASPSNHLNKLSALLVSLLSALLLLLSLANAARLSQTSLLSKLYKAKYHVINNASFVDKASFDFSLAKRARINVEHNNNNNNNNNNNKRHPQTMKERDRIEKLPGQPHNVKLRQYGGYVTVDSKAGRAFYYYFVEADPPTPTPPPHDHSAFPLLLWLNGGPGCSSLAYGAMEELGPFRVKSDGKSLYHNRYAWNRAANVLFLESPAGVGFSYSNTTSDYDNNGDAKTAEDNYVFLINWFERFPEYKGKEFYISGESYAGHYVPQLAHAILQHNEHVAEDSRINLKGIIIGNAVINDETDMKGMYEYFWTHALISDHLRNQIMRHCDFSPNAITQTTPCNSATDDVELDIQFLDIYNIYAPICLSTNLTLKPIKPTQVLDPCSDNYVYAYLNTPEVQQALHANVTKLSYDWQPCSEVIDQWLDSPSTIIPLLKEFISKGLRVWIYSGDTDGRIPVTSTRQSIDVMGLGIETKWHPWYIKGEVGGYTQVYEGNLTFATVRGAGHQVPSFQPLRALAMIMHFLDGTPLPDTTQNKMY